MTLGGIILDTSSILFALSNKVDIFIAAREELSLDPVISLGVVRELRRISKSAKVSSKAANVALELIKKREEAVVPDNQYVDDWILSAAGKYEGVCTNDTKLRRALRANGVKVYAVSRSGEFR